MSIPPFNPQLLASTRGRILALLRRKSRTVEELAQALDLTDNAIRGHLERLERAGLVHQRGLRRGIRKPAYAYELTPHAEHLFPKAYGLVLLQFMNVLDEQLSREQVEALLWRIGQRLAGEQPVPTGDLHARLEAAVAVLNGLGGVMELEDHAEVFSICGYSCPLLAVVQAHPEICRLSQALLTTLVGEPVQERCERSESLWCWFEVPKHQGGEHAALYPPDQPTGTGSA